MKRQIYICLSFTLLISACVNKKNEPPKSSYPIVRQGERDSIFTHLMSLTEHSIDPETRKDSLSFLILPLQASCPSCRDKTIDSIIKYSNRLKSGQFIILSAKSGRKTIKAFFTDKNYTIPEIKGHLFIDSIDMAGQYGLYENNPSIYYMVYGQPYKKVLSLPATIKKDLRRFFETN